MCFLERLARALNMDEISCDIGVDLHTESLLLRAEQLARLESDKLVDKVSLVGEINSLVKLPEFGFSFRLCALSLYFKLLLWEFHLVRSWLREELTLWGVYFVRSSLHEKFTSGEVDSIKSLFPWSPTSFRREWNTKMKKTKTKNKPYLQMLCCGYGTLPRLRREKTFHGLTCNDVRVKSLHINTI